LVYIANGPKIIYYTEVTLFFWIFACNERFRNNKKKNNRDKWKR